MLNPLYPIWLHTIGVNRIALILGLNKVEDARRPFTPLHLGSIIEIIGCPLSFPLIVIL